MLKLKTAVVVVICSSVQNSSLVVVETSIISSWGSLRKRSILFSQSSSKNTIRLKVCPMICLHKLILLWWLYRWKIELILNYCNADGWRRWWWCLSFCLSAGLVLVFSSVYLSFCLYYAFWKKTCQLLVSTIFVSWQSVGVFYWMDLNWSTRKLFWLQTILEIFFLLISFLVIIAFFLLRLLLLIIYVMCV